MDVAGIRYVNQVIILSRILLYLSTALLIIFYIFEFAFDAPPFDPDFAKFLIVIWLVSLPMLGISYLARSFYKKED